MFIGTLSVAIYGLIRHGSFFYDIFSVSGAFTGKLNVCCIFGDYVVSNHGVYRLSLFQMYLLMHL
jgi:hypothetical protein